MEPRLRLQSMALVALLGISCATFGINETARTAPQDGFQFGGGLTPLTYYYIEGTSGGLTLPLPELFFKYGAEPNFDIGARWAFGPGITLTTKYQFLRSGIDGALTVYGSLYGLWFGGVGGGFYSISPRLILSNEKPGGFPFQVNAGVDYPGVFGSAEASEAGAGALFAVGGLGLPFRVFDRGQARLMPELSLRVPLLGRHDYGGGGGLGDIYGGFGASLGVSFAYAGADEEQWE